MIEKWLEFKAISFFLGIYIMIGVIAVIGTVVLTAWIYKKMCEHRKKRLERMYKKFKEEKTIDEGDSAELPE